MNNFSKRLKLILTTLQLKQREFAEPIGVDASRVSQWLNESLNLKPNLEQFAAISKVYNVNINWLILGHGEMFLKKEDENQKNNDVEIYFSTKEIIELQKQLLECREETIKLYRQLNLTPLSK